MTLLSFLGSVAAVLAVVALARMLRLGQPSPLDEAAARRIAEETFHGHRFAAATVSQDGQGALVEGADAIALVRAHGDKWVARLLALPLTARAEGERLIVPAAEAMFGATTLVLEPQEAARWAAKLSGKRDA